MLQTAKKILTNTKFHLWDVLKLKKRIIFHFRLFCSTFGHLKKKVKNVLKNSKTLIFLKFQILICGRNWPGIVRYVAGRSAQPSSLPKIFFMPNRQKLTNLSQKNIPRSPKTAFFFFGGGGGSADKWSLRTKCLGLIDSNYVLPMGITCLFLCYQILRKKQILKRNLIYLVKEILMSAALHNFPLE